jgi:ADP-heptose:LPS heptosyltransferase
VRSRRRAAARFAAFPAPISAVPASRLGAPDFAARSAGARRVLVVDLGFLGDSVHLVPALWALKAAHPGAELHTVSARLGAEVLALAPCVDRAWGVELHPRRRRVGEQWALIRQLRALRFDVAVNFSGADRSVFFTALTGARLRLGRPGGRWHAWNRWLIRHWVEPLPHDRPVWAQHLEVLRAAGFSGTPPATSPPRFDLRVPDAAAAWATKNVPAGAVHLSINASSPFKEWPLGRWREFVGELLAAPDVEVIATGSAAPREQERLAALAAGFPRLRVFAGNLTVAQLAAAVARCAVHVGLDSGVTHLAYAMGVPTVSVYRDYPGLAEWAPRGPRHACITAPCGCDGALQPACAAAQEAGCLARIAPAEVLDLLRLVRR